ncbi:hypothetical protein [Amycolatopsis sp. BJA-103]|uniref:hypothetical protein n=1 Tax=Amycolatopsis sp. BJA-103 TaxID=1911175 RepID=UPI000C7779BD|nr:hypothetical protein [Amycolatopsis sp. BJA-103]AUI61807.1 hypothetical protein BKN51_29035 [Amycolatopsis sp. BJA-103]PNE20894.1 hypothetical protein B1H26_03400 [Amycolatopsis sp. BJA-103]
METDYVFPGRRVTAVSMVLGPVLLLTGTLLRSRFNFFFPDQLRAMSDHPALMTAAYTCFLAGNVLLWPAILALATKIGRTKPALAAWGGLFVLIGLFERTFHAGIDQAALGLAERRGAGFAESVVSESYQDLHLFSFLSFTIMFGWYVLAFAAYRAKVLGVVQSIGLATMGLLPLGVLKGTEIVSIIGTAGLCVALVPAGIRVLLESPKPSRKTVLLTAITVPVLGALAFASTLG